MTHTVSEREFEDFLRRNNIAFQPIPQADAPRPDYIVACGAARIVFEIKELSEDADFSKQPLQASSRTVGEHKRQEQ